MTHEPIPAFETISEGTHCPVDLAQALLPYARRFLSAATIAALEATVEAGDDDADAVESVQEAVEELGEYAAPFCYIAFHEFDGASLGCWPDVESALDDADVLRVADTSEIPADYEGFALHVNERGNATLYECHGASYDTPDSPVVVEIWGIV